MREQRKKIAQETLKIQQQGFYTAQSGKLVDISSSQKQSENLSSLITPEEGLQLKKTLQGENIKAFERLFGGEK